MFQQFMDNLISNMHEIIVYFDDILITKSAEEEHFETLDQVLSCWDKAVLFSLSAAVKTQLLAPSLSYLGHTVGLTSVDSTLK